jgi:hypothetical protein
MTSEQLIRDYYSGWDKHEWSIVDGILADGFTFTSPNGDDHISKSAFMAKCWHGQVEFIGRFDLESVFSDGTEGFAKYLCHTTKGTAFRNVEYFRFANEKVTAIESYFGGNKGYPRGSATGKS